MRPGRALARALVLCAAALASGALAAPDLQGCWRLQHLQQRMTDGRVADTNMDCVREYDGSVMRSACLMPDGKLREARYAYRLDGPGRYLATQLNPDPAFPAAAQERAYTYVLDERWLTMEAIPIVPVAGQRAVAEKIVSLTMRVPPGPGGKLACHPRGPSGWTGGRPGSSLVLEPPAGYRPVSKPVGNRHLASALGRNLLVGQFVLLDPKDVDGPAEGSRGVHVMVFDDVGVGPHPMKPAGFPAYKAARKAEHGTAPSCDRDGVLCFGEAPKAAASANLPDATVFVAYVNVAGRVAVVSAVAFGPARAADGRAREALDLFVARLQAANR